MFKLLFILWLLAMCSPAEADVIGTLPNRSGGFIYFTDDKPKDCSGFYYVESRSIAGQLQHHGCYGRHNTTLIVLWVQGPAEVVDIENVKWAEDDADEAPAQSEPRG